VFAAMTPDIEWDESEGMPYGGVYYGCEAIVSDVFGPILADVDGFSAAPDEILPLGDTPVVALGRHGGQGANGPVRARLVLVWTVTDGRVSRYQQLAAHPHLQTLSASEFRRPPEGRRSPQTLRHYWQQSGAIRERRARSRSRSSSWLRNSGRPENVCVTGQRPKSPNDGGGSAIDDQRRGRHDADDPR
jgi:ketosteroid isomerase-like protein